MWTNVRMEMRTNALAAEKKNTKTNISLVNIMSFFFVRLELTSL